MTRADLHRLVDELPEYSVEPVGSLLVRALEDPVLAMHLAAPIDDEPLTPEDEAAVERGRQNAVAGATQPLAAVLSELDAGD